jgi:CubicO group peptidase (beta-lactamase class C family)
MTKPITGMAAMHLISQGKLGLDQPVHEILPKYRHMAVQDTYDGSITALHPAKSPITIRQLMTHTAGLGYTIVQSGPIHKLMVDKGLIPGQISRIPVPGIFNGTPSPSLEAFADRLAEVPLVHDPGTAWSYSMGLDLLGRVIEVVSGKPFDVYLHDTIFAPAGMTSTFFQVPAGDAHRLTTNYGVVGGILVPIDEGANSIYLDPPPFPFGARWAARASTVDRSSSRRRKGTRAPSRVSISWLARSRARESAPSSRNERPGATSAGGTPSSSANRWRRRSPMGAEGSGVIASSPRAPKLRLRPAGRAGGRSGRAGARSAPRRPPPAPGAR